MIKSYEDFKNELAEINKEAKQQYKNISKEVSIQYLMLTTQVMAEYIIPTAINLSHKFRHFIRFFT